MQQLGRNIKRFRKLLMITQAQLGDILQVSKKTVYTWEKGDQIPSRHHIRKMLSLFNASEYALFCHLDTEESLSAAIDKLHHLPEASKLCVINFIVAEWENLNPPPDSQTVFCDSPESD